MTDDFRSPTALPDAACAVVDERLMDYLEGELPAAGRAAVDAHLAACARCRAVVADLRAITADAAALPAPRLERDLWAGIAERIEAPVVPFPARDGAPPLQVHPTTVRRAGPSAGAAPAFPRRWLAAAAVALMAATSGVTYLLTRGGAAPAVAVTAPTPSTDAAVPATVPAAPELAAVPVDSPSAPAAPQAAPAPLAPASRLVARRPDPAAGIPGVADYDRAIASLRTAVRERRADLDSGTVAVLERNLRIIDEAIRQSREALLTTPANPMLERALTKALDRKVELLRTAAQLPRS
jgi:hypothetical protein